MLPLALVAAAWLAFAVSRKWLQGDAELLVWVALGVGVLAATIYDLRAAGDRYWEQVQKSLEATRGHASKGQVTRFNSTRKRLVNGSGAERRDALGKILAEDVPNPAVKPVKTRPAPAPAPAQAPKAARPARGSKATRRKQDNDAP
jgi:hypothetical protein